LFLCRSPNPDNVLIIQTPAGTFSSKKLVQSNGKVAASRLIRKDIPLDLPLEVEISENLSAARCRIYVRKDLKVLLYYICIVMSISIKNLFLR
jgi:hypothetical protein